MRRTLIPFSLMACAMILAPLQSSDAQTAAELLQQGIYQQETVGNLEQAIKLYREVIGQSQSTQQAAAEAQLRLGECLLRQGEQDDAVEAFRAVVERYADQTDKVEKARAYLPDAIEFLPPPWQDGERFSLTMRLPNGDPIGLIGVGIDSVQYDQKQCSKVTVIRYAGWQNQGISHALVDRNTHRPLKTTWEHTVLGNANGKWSSKEVVIDKQDADGNVTTTTVPLKDNIYCNDQWFYGMRQLPLAVGYQVTVPLRVAFTGGTPLGFKISVTDKEVIQTNAGEFDSFKIETNIGQTFWIADVPERYLVRLVAGAVDAVLSEKPHTADPSKYINETVGFSATVPSGWHHFTTVPDNPKDSGVLRCVSPQLATAKLTVRDIKSLSAEQQDSLDVWADKLIADQKRQSGEVEIDSSGVQPTELAGLDARTFTVKHTSGKRQAVAKIILAKNDKHAVTVEFSVSPQHWKEAAAVFDQFQRSVQLD